MPLISRLRSLRPLAAAAVLAPTLAACGDDATPVRGERVPLTPAAVTADSVANVRTLAGELWTVQRWLYDAPSIADVESILGAGTDGTEPAPAPNFLFLPDEEVDFESFMDDVEAFFRDHAFTASQIESQSTTEVVYRLAPDVFCDAEWGDDEVDTCREVLTKLEVRLRVVSFAEGDVDVTVLVGPSRAAAAELALHQDVMSLELEVAPSLEALEALLDAGAEDEVAAADITGSGSLRFVVRRLAEGQVRLSAEVTSALTLGVAQDGDAISIELGLGSAAIDIDAVAQRGTADLDLGRVAVTAPAETVIGGDCVDNITVDANGNENVETECEEPPEGTLAFELGGAAAYFDFTDTERRLDLRGLVAGPAKLAVDGQTVVEATLDDGQTAFDFHAKVLDEEVVQLSTSRALDAAMLLRLGLAPDIFGDLEGSFLADEDLGAALTGDAPEALLTKHGLSMTHGSLTLTSKHAKSPTVVIAEGMCASFPETADVSDAPVDGEPPADGSATEETDPHPFDLEVGDTCGAPDPV